MMTGGDTYNNANHVDILVHNMHLCNYIFSMSMSGVGSVMK